MTKMRTTFDGKPFTLAAHPGSLGISHLPRRVGAFTLMGENRFYSPARFLELDELKAMAEEGRLPKDAYEWAVVQYMEDSL